MARRRSRRKETALTRPRPAARSRTRALFPVLLTVVAVALGLITAGGTAGATGTHTTPAPPVPARIAPRLGTLHYALDKPVCRRPVDPHGWRCFALKRVDVAKGTPGAVRYVTSRGVTYGPAGGYTPADLASAYHFNPAVNRSTQTVGIVDWFDDPNVLKDLNAFDHHYGLAAETRTSFRKLNQKGQTKPLPRPDRDSASETALDVEAVRSVCHTCRILLVEASTDSDASIAAAENTAARLGASEISNSFGEPESQVSAATRAAFRHPGIAVTAATGDDGWYEFDGMNAAYASAGEPEFPASLPSTVAVGGTTLVLGADGTRTDEYVWNDNGTDDTSGWATATPAGASGGGCSRRFAAPAWQGAHAGYAAAGCRGTRLSADVSAIADPAHGFDVYDSYGSGGWATFGGTSLASPVVAALYALAGGSGGSAFPAASMYVNSGYRPSSLVDVTQGGNGFCAGDATAACRASAVAISKQVTLNPTTNPNAIGYGPVECSYPRGASTATPAALSSECNAVKGFDGASGLGVAASPQLFTPTSPHVGLSLPTSRVRAGGTARIAVKIVNRLPKTSVSMVVWSFGDGTSVHVRSGAVSHRYKRAGRYRITVTVVDSRHQAAIRTGTVRIG